jgi:hypothetical protein
MSLNESLKILDIEDYEDKIFSSSSKGGIMHVLDYPYIASWYAAQGYTDNWFREWFVDIVKKCESWERPESVYQHIPRLLKETRNLEVVSDIYD